MAPKPLPSLRVVQAILVVPFIILLAYCGTHRAWWSNINAAIAVGVIAAVFTLALALSSLVFSKKPPRSLILTIGIDAVILVLWAVTIALMLRRKTGCDFEQNQYDPRYKMCNPNGHPGVWDHPHDKHILLRDQPVWEWDFCAGVVGAEILVFIASIGVLGWNAWKGKGASNDSGADMS